MSEFSISLSEKHGLDHNATESFRQALVDSGYSDIAADLALKWFVEDFIIGWGYDLTAENLWSCIAVAGFLQRGFEREATRQTKERERLKLEEIPIGLQYIKERLASKGWVTFDGSKLDVRGRGVPGGGKKK